MYAWMWNERMHANISAYVWDEQMKRTNERMCVLCLCHTRGFSLALIVMEVFSIHALKCSFSQVHLLGDCNLNSLRILRYMWLSGQEWSPGATNGIFCFAINFISHCEYSGWNKQTDRASERARGRERDKQKKNSGSAQCSPSFYRIGRAV